METFTLNHGASDLVWKELHGLTALELHSLSRRAFLEGLIATANHIQSFIFMKYNSRIPYRAVIGTGTKLGYGGIGVVIHSSAKIGKNCLIGQNVTLGARGGGNGASDIGDNVYIAPGAICLGGKIGDNVVVGANSVVLKEIPSNCVVAGTPTKGISTDIEKYQAYTVGRRK